MDTDSRRSSADERRRLARLGLALPTLYLPRAEIDLHRWAVIACDQFTNDVEYWQGVERTVGDAPSTLRYIIPEVYLDTIDVQKRVRHTQARINSDAAAGILKREDEPLVWVRRAFADGSVRNGLLFAIDLERYEYRRERSALIRATEQTFAERIAPRRAIRTRADFELSHILVLYDDPQHTVDGDDALNDDGDARRLYTTELMYGGGEVAGYALAAAARQRVIGALERLRDGDGGNGALFFVGDGNHSLAAAKEHWNALRDGGAPQTHPARYALVELVNIHDRGLKFEPIHKYIVIDDGETAEERRRAADTLFATLQRAAAESATDGDGGNATDRAIHFEYRGDSAEYMPPPSVPADVALQQIVPPAAAMRFCHSTREFDLLNRDHIGIAVRMPAPDRSAILHHIAANGVLPKKSFSLGMAEEKRYYIECRKIT